MDQQIIGARIANFPESENRGSAAWDVVRLLEVIEYRQRSARIADAAQRRHQVEPLDRRCFAQEQRLRHQRHRVGDLTRPEQVDSLYPHANIAVVKTAEEQFGYVGALDVPQLLEAFDSHPRVSVHELPLAILEGILSGRMVMQAAGPCLLQCAERLTVHARPVQTTAVTAVLRKRVRR